MVFQRLEDLRIDADLTQQQVADILAANGKFLAAMKKASTKYPPGL